MIAPGDAIRLRRCKAARYSCGAPMRMTLHEIGLVATMLAILLVGAIVRHYRHAAREKGLPPASEAHATSVSPRPALPRPQQ